MTAAPCACDHALPAHYLWSGCSATGCPCTYRLRPTSTPAARAAALRACAEAVEAARLRRTTANPPEKEHTP